MDNADSINARYVQRVVHAEGRIQAPAEEVWALITQWGGIMRWWHSVPNPLYPLVNCDLLPGQTEQDLPRTRRCVNDTSKATGAVPIELGDVEWSLPEYVDEHLILQDDKARFLAYCYNPEFHSGVTTIQVTEEGAEESCFIIKYTVLEAVDRSMALPKSAPAEIQDAFAPGQDYIAFKIFVEKEYAARREAEAVSQS